MQDDMGENKSEPPGAGNTATALDIGHWIGVSTMPVDRHYPDSARARNPEQNEHRLTPGSQPWKAEVLRQLGEGFGVEDIALHLRCDAAHVRKVVETLHRLGLLPELYARSRGNWKPIGALARKMVENAGGEA